MFDFLAAPPVIGALLMVDYRIGSIADLYVDTSHAPPVLHGATVDLRIGSATDPWGDVDRIIGANGIIGSQLDDALYCADVPTGTTAFTIFAGSGDDSVQGGSGSEVVTAMPATIRSRQVAAL